MIIDHPPAITWNLLEKHLLVAPYSPPSVSELPIASTSGYHRDFKLSWATLRAPSPFTPSTDRH